MECTNGHFHNKQLSVRILRMVPIKNMTKLRTSAFRTFEIKLRKKVKISSYNFYFVLENTLRNKLTGSQIHKLTNSQTHRRTDGKQNCMLHMSHVFFDVKGTWEHFFFCKYHFLSQFLEVNTQNLIFNPYFWLKTGVFCLIISQLLCNMFGLCLFGWKMSLETFFLLQLPHFFAVLRS